MFITPLFGRIHLLWRCLMPSLSMALIGCSASGVKSSPGVEVPLAEVTVRSARCGVMETVYRSGKYWEFKDGLRTHDPITVPVDHEQSIYCRLQVRWSDPNPLMLAAVWTYPPLGDDAPPDRVGQTASYWSWRQVDGNRIEVWRSYLNSYRLVYGSTVLYIYRIRDPERIDDAESLKAEIAAGSLIYEQPFELIKR